METGRGERENRLTLFSDLLIPKWALIKAKARDI